MLADSSYNDKNFIWSNTSKLKSFDLLLHQNTGRKWSASVLTVSPEMFIRHLKIIRHFAFPAIPAFAMCMNTLTWWSSSQQFISLPQEGHAMEIKVRIDGGECLALWLISAIPQPHNLPSVSALAHFVSPPSCPSRMIVYNHHPLPPQLLAQHSKPLKSLYFSFTIGGSGVIFQPCFISIYPSQEREVRGAVWLKGGGCHV